MLAYVAYAATKPSEIPGRERANWRLRQFQKPLVVIIDQIILYVNVHRVAILG